MSDSEGALRILAETIKDQSRSQKDQAEVLGRLLQSVHSLQDNLIELKSATNTIREKTDRIDLCAENTHAVFNRRLDDFTKLLNTVQGQIREVEESIPEMVEGINGDNMRRAVSRGINDSLLCGEVGC